LAPCPQVAALPFPAGACGGLAEAAGIVFDRKHRPRAAWFSDLARGAQPGGKGSDPSMRKLLLTTGFLALAVGLLWIGQGTGAIAWPPQSFMINQLQWAGYGAVLGAVGLILIWQGKN